jgi:hypothetical protein
MDQASVIEWFQVQTQPFKNFVLLQFANQLTLVMRDISTTKDEEKMLKAGWVITECQHRILGYVTAAMVDSARYPDDVIIKIVFNHITHPVLEPYTGWMWAKTIERAERFGSSLKG